MTENEAPMFLHLRKEPFEYGLLPLPHLMFTDGTATLKPVKEKLLQNSFTYVVNNNNVEGFLLGSRSLGRPVNTVGIAESLQISEDHARVVLDTFASVLPDYGGHVDTLPGLPMMTWILLVPTWTIWCSSCISRSIRSSCPVPRAPCPALVKMRHLLPMSGLPFRPLTDSLQLFPLFRC